MKNLSTNFNRLAGVLAASLLVAGASSALAQFASPVGTWDCVVSGRERGVAYLTFNSDYTISGYEVLTPKQVGVQTDDNPRGADTGRTFDSSTGQTTTTTNFSGFLLLSGFWSHDFTGKKILGFYTEGNFSQSCTTNTAVNCIVTNEVVDLGGGTYVTNTTTVCTTNYDNVVCEVVGLTNGLSFSAVVRPGSRLSLKSTSINGNKTLKGVVATEIPDLSGNYYAEGKKSGVKFTEFLGAESSVEYPNMFDVTGGGPGYVLLGRFIASSQKKMGLYYVTTEDNNPLTSLFGPINYTTGKGNLKGFDTKEQKVTYKLTPQFFPD